MRNRILTAAALALGLALAGCDSFDPLDKFQDWDIMGSSKTPLKGERRPVFDHGVPGTPQGVPPELVKGYQPPPEEPPKVVEAKPEKKPRPKKVAARPKPQPVRQAQPQGQQQQQQQQVEQGGWADPPAPPARQAGGRTTTQPVSGNATQTMPGAQPTWPTDAQPAPQR